MKTIVHYAYRSDASRWFFGIAAALTVLFLMGIFFFLALVGLQAFNTIPFSAFLFGSVWNPTSYHTPSWGIGALLLGSLLVSMTALAISVPFGLSIAVYLAEIAPQALREVVKPTIEMIASIPSVVLGLLGLLFFAPLLGRTFGLANGLNALTASLLVAVAALPSIASICEDALTGVSRRYRDSSFALGATKWQTIKKTVLPAAQSGILAGILLGFARIIGETMIVLMVAGNSVAVPHSLFDPVRPMTANIAIEIKEAVVGSVHWEGLFAIGLVLFVITFFLNLLADIAVRKKIKA